MEISDRGLKMMMAHEGFRATAYPDPGSVNGEPWTIGFGSTIVNGIAVKKGDRITKAKAMEALRNDIRRVRGPFILAAVAPFKPNQNQFDALVSLVYNIGTGAFKKSTICKRLKVGDVQAAANAFNLYIKNDGKVMAGLARRRAEERELFLEPVGASYSASNGKVDPSPIQPNFVSPDASVTLPCTKPDPERSLFRSREIFGGGLLGSGSLIQMANPDDLGAIKEGLTEYKTDKQSQQYMEPTPTKNYFVEVISVLTLVIGIYIIYKRIKDRRKGHR